jgi:undecaprenyl-diphosphatase
MRRKSWIGAADRALMARVAATDSVLLDRVLPRLGHAANHGLLWFGVAAALGLTRSRRARRAALRGVVGLSLASPPSTSSASSSPAGSGPPST